MRGRVTARVRGALARRWSGGLFRRRTFRLLWIGETTSQLGSAVTTVALPLLAAESLHASAFEVALLTAATWLPWLLIGLLAGAWVDRLPKRPLMLACDIVSIVLLASVPIADWCGVLTIGQLLVVALLAGVSTVFFTSAYYAYLPALVVVGRADHFALIAMTRRFRRPFRPHRPHRPHSSVAPTWPTAASNLLSLHAPQADRGPEESSSLVTLARRSQPGRKGPVNSRIPKTLTTSISRDPGVDRTLPVWLPCGRQGGEGGRLRPAGDPATLLPQHARPDPFPSEPGPPEACSSQ